MREPVEAAVDAAGDLPEIARVRERVEAPAGPEPGGDAEAHVDIRGPLGVGLQVEAQRTARGPVVVPAGELDGAPALVALAVSRLRVAQVPAALVRLTGGELLEEAQLSALVG